MPVRAAISARVSRRSAIRVRTTCSSVSARSRRCRIVSGNFPREQALAWDAGIVDYVESNQFFENYLGPGDHFFGSVGSKPEIYTIHWSPAQTEAR